MTVQEWIDELNKLAPEVKQRKLAVWMPGSIIDLDSNRFPIVFDDSHPKYRELVMLEGNVRPGSALGSTWSAEKAEKAEDYDDLYGEQL